MEIQTSFLYQVLFYGTAKNAIVGGVVIASFWPKVNFVTKSGLVRPDVTLI